MKHEPIVKSKQYIYLSLTNTSFVSRFDHSFVSEFVHPHLKLYGLNDGKGRNALTFLYEKGEKG